MKYLILLLLLIPAASATPALERCDFLKQLDTAKDYAIICTNETEGHIYYNESKITVGNIKTTDINILSLILFHELGHYYLGINEDKAAKYSVMMMNTEYIKRIVDLYNWVGVNENG